MSLVDNDHLSLNDSSLSHQQFSLSCLDNNALASMDISDVEDYNDLSDTQIDNICGTVLEAGK